jgi:hypothetical protein
VAPGDREVLLEVGYFEIDGHAELKVDLEAHHGFIHPQNAAQSDRANPHPSMIATMMADAT